MRVRLTDPTQLEDFLDFIWGSGFIGVVEGPDLVSVSLPYSLGTVAQPLTVELFLSVWLGVGIRVWNDLSPEGEALVLGEPDRVGASRTASP